MITLRRIGHAAFDTPDIERQVDYYTQVLGLVLTEKEKDRAFLASRLGLLAIELNRGDAARCKKLSFDVGADADLAAIAKALSADGVRSERKNDAVPGISNTLTFHDLKGTAIELFTSSSALGNGAEAKGAGCLKLGHVAFSVVDAQAAADFYVRVLGFRVSDWIEDFFVFLRCSPDHHAVNFIRGSKNQLHHIAFELRNWAQVQTACDVLGKHRLALIWGPVRVGPGHNVAIYHRNPDDQVVEMFCELDQMKDEALGFFEPRPWHRDRPQRPKVWKRGESPIWGLPPVPDFFRGRE